MGIKGMKKIIKIFILIFIAFSFSCEEHGILIDCKDCTEEEPEDALLELSLDVFESGTPTKINIYEGNLEDDCLYKSFNTTLTGTTIPVTLNKKYTVTAEYNVSGKIYTAVDSATPRLKYNKDQCDNPCYFVYDKKVNLKLKYTK
jgi:hypothetical protein